MAALRAAHQLVDGEPRVLDDPVILRLLGIETLDTIKEDRDHAAAAWQHVLAELSLPYHRNAGNEHIVVYDRGGNDVFRNYVLEHNAVLLPVAVEGCGR